MVKELVIVKKPRKGPIPDKPIAFPPLYDLQLELLEVKDKLKKNLPPIKIAPKSAPKKDSTGPVVVIQQPPAVVQKPESPPPVKGPTRKKKSAEPQSGADEDLVAALGDDSPKKSPKLDAIEIEYRADGDDGVPEELLLEPTDVPSVAGGEETPEAGEDAPEEGDEVVDEEEDGEPEMTQEEKDALELEEYIWRFRILKKQYKDKTIPTYNEHDDLSMVKKAYNNTVKDIQLESSVESYRSYLVGGFMLLEYTSNSFMGINLNGFTSQQMLIMHKYDVLLIELGERSYNRWGLNLPVEIRLIGFIIIQAGLFYLGKIIAEKGGGTFSEIFKAMTGQSVSGGGTSTGSKESPEGKKKMRGPSIRVEDIPT